MSYELLYDDEFDPDNEEWSRDIFDVSGPEVDQDLDRHYDYDTGEYD